MRFFWFQNHIFVHYLWNLAICKVLNLFLILFVLEIQAQSFPLEQEIFLPSNFQLKNLCFFVVPVLKVFFNASELSYSEMSWECSWYWRISIFTLSLLRNTRVLFSHGEPIVLAASFLFGRQTFFLSSSESWQIEQSKKCSQLCFVSIFKISHLGNKRLHFLHQSPFWRLWANRREFKREIIVFFFPSKSSYSNFC